MMRVAIFGAGAVGGHLAARLADAGVDVGVVARGAHLEAIQQDGLRLITHDVTLHVRVRATAAPEELGPQDLVISTLKAHALSAAAPLFAPLLGDDTPVVFAVNGIPWWYGNGPDHSADGLLRRLDPDGALARHIAYRRVLGCVLRSPNQIVSPGVVRNNAPTNRFAIGEPDGGNSARVDAIVALLRRGVPGAYASQSIKTEVWRKLSVNVPSSLLASLTLSTSPDLFADPDTRDIYRRVGEELAKVAAAYGIDTAFDLEAQAVAAGSHRHPPSMLQDLLAGRQLEVDAQVGAVQDLARGKGVTTPTMDLLAALLARRMRADVQA